MNIENKICEHYFSIIEQNPVYNEITDKVEYFIDNNYGICYKLESKPRCKCGGSKEFCDFVAVIIKAVVNNGKDR